MNPADSDGVSSYGANQPLPRRDVTYPGVAYIIPLPYWIYTDPDTPPSVASCTLHDVHLRVYPPFQSGPTNVVTTPCWIDAEKVPFLSGQRPAKLAIAPAPIAVPQIGGTSTKLFFPVKNRPPQPPHNLLPKNTLRIDTYSDEKASGTRAVLFMQERLLNLLRWRSGQWWVTRSNSSLSRTGFFQFPVDGNGKPVPSHEMNRPEFAGDSNS